ncbi:MAG: MFS transporter [Caldimonas sp.]
MPVSNGLLMAAVVALRVPDLPGEAAAGSASGATGGSGSGPAGAGPDAAGGTARRRRPAPTTTIRSVALAHKRILLTIGVGILLVSAVRASRQAVLPLWAEQIGLDAAVTALIYGLAGGIEMLVFLPAGRVMDRRGRLWVAVPCTVLMGVALFFIPFTHSDTTLLMAALLLGFGNGIGSGLIMTLGADYSPSPGRAHFLGVWRLMADLGSTGGPALLSAVTAATALSAAIWCTALVAFAAAGVLGHWIPRTRIRAGPGKTDAT